MPKQEVSEEKSEGNKITDLPGIGPGSAKKLEDAGVYDLMSLAVMSPKDLSDMAGIGEAVARKAIQSARKMLDLGFVDGMEYARKREDVHFITTGSKNLDGLLGGKGVESRAITEAFGAYGSGKTQVGLSLAVNVQLPKEQGGASGKCVFIDTEGTFRPARVKQLAEQHNLAVYVTNQVMSNPAQMFGDPTVAIGGNIVGHASTYRIYLRRGKQGSRVAKLIDSPNLPENEVMFFLTEKGIQDEG